ncbi:sugar transferase [Clostridium sartagoforme AAU1]|uniref:Sugar transferase n=1 Tax=Clostridium sartagoforme AAU1 TaxID=1202534 RepID=R9C5I0_9CLOT|nr:sugar transferase [Clostridium sartagoforme]EOR24562.1 sugar transferase [Clostridium sartagoforme AAU1]
MRKTSLDELPQLINILKGDMSIVGPRPIVEKEIEKYGSYAEAVFSILPGLTGYWQANGRSDTTYDERVKMDMYYIKNRSLLMDIKIILKTFISVIKKEGAV